MILASLKNNVLILVPGKNARGGITNYYYSIRKNFPENIHYAIRGARTWPNKSNKFSEGIRFISDYVNFTINLFRKDIQVVQTTTAFYGSCVIRDGIFLFIARLFGKKTIVFFRGWDDKFVYSISGLKKKIVEKVFFRSNVIIDLSQKNIDHLKQMGFKNKLILETTLVDEALVKDIDVNACIHKRVEAKTKNILFLSRVEKTKGIYVLLEAFKKINAVNPDVDLIYAGDGLELNEIKERVAKEKISNVTFTGFVDGKAKQELFMNASVFVFLSEFEGMPNAVLEAMAFGLPVITTDVGGIASVFVNEKNGYLLKETNTQVIAENINTLLYNKELNEKISTLNYNEAKEKFWSNVVAERMKVIFSAVINEK
ncbi:MAG: glycosyltransferase family 4 protein [Bacteroidia bacterium]